MRIHSGPDAALAADSVRAAAFTAGEHIVFGGGRYQPHREEGRRLLAHELAHVAQHTGPAFEAPREIASDDDPAEREAERLAALSAGPLPVRTAARPGALYRQAEAAACSLDPGLPSQAGEVIDKAKERLDTLSSFTAADPTSDQRIALRGLSRHFALAAADVPKHLPRIRERVGAISSTAASIRGGNMRCAAPDDGFCAIADAYVQRDSLGSPTMTFCPSFLAKGTMGQVETFIHEVSHAADPEIKDWVYASQRAYSRLTTDLALRNADSYSYFITEMRETISGETRELPTGEARHPDRFEECGAHQTVLAAALAEAELANYEALRVFSSPDLIQARAERLATFGIVSNDGSGCKVNQALAARYRALFEAADAIFGGSLRVRCDTDTDCEGGPARYADGVLHVCWKWDASVSRFPFFGWAHAILQGLHNQITGVPLGEVPGAPVEFRTGNAASIASWLIWELRAEGGPGASNPLYCAPPPEPLRPDNTEPGARKRDSVRKGDAGWPVPELQAKLGILVDAKLPVTGVFDGATETALVSFQTGRQLLEAGAARGVADARTWAALFAASPGYHGMPTGETFLPAGFRKDDDATMLDFNQKLLPANVNYKGLVVTELDPGGGINTCCTRSPCHKSITSGTWTVGDENIYGLDTVGVQARQVDLYRARPNFEPCYYLVPQLMVADLPEGQYEFVRGAQLFVVTKDSVTVTKINKHDTKSDTRKYP